ncbi:MAG: putative cyclohex-ene-carboxylate:CoA ligase [Frankiales bacterium]|nr:putative cyclohex-ene-carboxylate:CoA ligase [Frankiales bacterium]
MSVVDLALPDAAGRSQVGWWELIRGRAAASPQAQAFVDDRGRRLTWLSYADTAERVAAGLWARGVRPGGTVSWQLPSSLEAAVLMAALARLGVRQNPVIPLLRRAELDVVVAELQPALLVVPRTWAGFDHEGLARDVAQKNGTDVLVLDLPGEELALPQGDPAVLPPVPARAPDQVRWVFYTSGTTGSPKGAMHTDASLVAAANGPVVHLELGPQDVIGMTYPLAHIGGPGMVGVTLRVGGSTMLVERFDPVRSPYDLARERVTLLGSAPPFFAAYLAAQEAHGSERLYPERVVCCNGGAPMSPTMFERLRTEIGGDGVFNAYGLTECPMVSYGLRAESATARPEAAGRPTPGVTVRIVDADERRCPPGEPGEVRVRGPQQFAGYVDPRHDAAAIDADGFVRTGDLGLVEPDGSLRLTGRLKEVIIRNAENISAIEVEAALMSHPSVADAAVVGIPDERTGERCCAVVVLAADAAPLTLEEVGVHFREREIARFKTPERLEIVDVLPRNAMGKVLKQKLRAELTASPS